MKMYKANFACSSVRDLVSNIKGKTQAEGVSKQGAEEIIWTKERGSSRRLEKTA
jgi:hypothetical protein